MSNSRTRSAIMGFVTDFGGQLTLIVVNFITVPLILNFTSPILYGFWLMVSSILGFLALTDFGIGMPLTRAIASVPHADKKDQLYQVISTGFFALCGVSLIFLCIGVILAFFIPGWFKIPLADQEYVIPAYFVAVTAASIALPSAIFSIILNGFQLMAIDNTVRNIVSVCGACLTIGLLYSGLGLMSIALSNLFIVCCSCILNYIYVRRLFPDLSIRLSSFHTVELKKLLKFGGYFQVGRIANTIAASADNIIIAGVLGASYVTPYSLTSKLPVLFSINIASKLPIAVFPAISQMFAEDNFVKLQSIFIKLGSLSIRLALMAACFIFIANQQFISLWVGPDSYGGVVLNSIFIYWVLQDTIYRSTTALVFASGDLRNWTIASILEGILNVTLSIILANFIGLVGVALGTALSKTLSTGIYTPYFISQKLKMPFKRFIYSGLFLPFLKSVPGCLLAWAISLIIPISLGWIWIIAVGVSIVFFNLLFFEGILLFFSPDSSWKTKFENILKFQD